MRKLNLICLALLLVIAIGCNDNESKTKGTQTNAPETKSLDTPATVQNTEPQEMLPPAPESKGKESLDKLVKWVTENQNEKTNGIPNKDIVGVMVEDYSSPQKVNLGIQSQKCELSFAIKKPGSGGTSYYIKTIDNKSNHKIKEVINGDTKPNGYNSSLADGEVKVKDGKYKYLTKEFPDTADICGRGSSYYIRLVYRIK
jgi:hypothetical protein